MKVMHFWTCGRKINFWKNANKTSINYLKCIHSTKTYEGFSMGYKVNRKGHYYQGAYIFVGGDGQKKEK